MLATLEIIIIGNENQSNTTSEDFSKRAERTLRAIEAAIDDAAIDCDAQRQGPVLTVEFDDGAKIIVNEHAAAQEIWVAAKSGGFHYRWRDAAWYDTKSGEELFGALSRLIGAHAGQSVELVAPASP